MNGSYLKRRLRIIGRKLKTNYYIWQLYNGIGSLLNKRLFASHCMKNLLITTRVLNEMGIPYWMTDGTLLGFYREGDFIEGDKDVDLGVFVEDWHPEMLAALRRGGMRLLRVNGTKEMGLEYTFTRKGVNLDIFFFYREAEHVWHATWLNGRPIRYRFKPFKLKKKSFRGHTFSVPEDTETYLIQKYGPTWHIPQKKWDWARDPDNIVP